MPEPSVFLRHNALHMAVCTPTHLDYLHRHLFSDAEAMRYLFDGKPFSAAETQALAQQHFSPCLQPTGLYVLLQATGHSVTEVVGFAGILPFSHPPFIGYEFGFAIVPHQQRKGYAALAARMQIHYWKTHLQPQPLYALAHPQNTASCHLLKHTLGLKEQEEITYGNRGKRMVFKVIYSDDRG